MKIDCRDLACPRPVIETKKALEELSKDENLQILLNSQTSKENVMRFLKSLNIEFETKDIEDESIISIKNKMPLQENQYNNDEFNVLFLKSDKVGEGELGQNLMVGFLKTLKDLDNFPKKILCVNNSVLINTDSSHIAFEAMKELEHMGVEIYSCGACLEYFGKTQELKIGKIGNAYEILNELFGKAKIISL
ncbi:sulfurtransferase-like selenium metabolism protein YedF [Campylobacter volucris]|uniref:Sulfurtransferase-like selenium metabolism protein YedF n=1 Tax=Campylobacter volucris TaxID=1031542 RepID=A0AAE5YJ94_9BACT|nr:sulfurtransferase-like selenium metabolism protein YedF [Campylobacter volucris]AJC93694.1 selenium metabolism protein [Campylobacter volucris LMG 24379]KAB0579827.1 sulfurtransferase-like selenium metabolism protein YedF [Campylobacter volucris]QBL13924.1 sulfurtransferase-like selenium metabolism protein YedF [Campylobacter volucris]QEL07907.1 selenium metabolism protein [Campylobacter volucris]TXK70751.1 sulfurtransferase-like selenium metabolism protein YedF [Campylobacter volucris]